MRTVRWWTSMTLWGQPAPDAPRYDAASEAEPLAQIQNSTEPYALKAVASEEAKALANACGALFIRGNRSERGGGIGCLNGGVVMGESDKAYSLTVTKRLGQTRGGASNFR